MKSVVITQLLRLIRYALAGVLSVLAIVAPAAFAEQNPEHIPFVPDASHLNHDSFAPEFSVTNTDTQAGAHPDLTFRMQKMAAHCRGFVDQCDAEDAYFGQNPKKIALHLPRGFVADANAAPYCGAFQDWVDSQSSPDWEVFNWRCQNPDAHIGTVDISATGCAPNLGNLDEILCTASDLTGPGDVFMENPDPGEQGHLVVLWPRVQWGPFTPETTYMVKSDVSVTVRDSDTGIDAVADSIPDTIVTTRRHKTTGNTVTTYGVGQVYELEMTLYGSQGLDIGHPLLTNSTFCDPQSLNGEAQGYAQNSELIFDEVGFTIGSISGSGGGITAPFSFPYQATDCDSVSYDPNLSISLDNQGPDQAPAISSTVTQQPGEATTDSVKVTFPSQFKINAENTAEHCSAADLAAESCPESSRVGTVTAESPLLPIGQRLEGNVYVAGLTGDSINISAFLTGFIDLRIDAEGRVEDDLTLTTTFSGLPAVPISRFDLNLEGGDKGLLRTPRICGPETITADFQSHSGRVKQNTVPVEITGCTDPALDVELSNRRKGELTDLNLSVGSPGNAIRSVEFGLARQLKWGRRKHNRVPKRKRLKSAGTASFMTLAGERRLRLKDRRTRRGNLIFTPYRRRTSTGELVAAQVPGFSANLFRTARHQPGIRARKRTLKRRRTTERRKRTVRRLKLRHQAVFTVTGLPGADTTAVELSLKGKNKRRRFYLKNPTGCGKRLNFVAYVTTTRGVRLALKDTVRLRGKGCRRSRGH